MTKLTEGRLSTVAHPAATRHVPVSGENTIPGMACMHQCSVSMAEDTRKLPSVCSSLL